MFSWKQKSDLDPYFRIVYALQLAAVVATFAGMFLIWWEGIERMTALDLLGRTTDEIERRSPQLLGQPLMVLWLLWPSVVVSGLRSFTGILVTPVSCRRLALAAWLAAMAAIIHFYISLGEDAAASPLREGEIRPGFWLTGSATVLLGLLLLVEGLIKPREAFFRMDEPAQPVSDAESLWRGDYLTCPYCGMLNHPQAKTCYNCRNLLFNFRDGDR